MGMTTITVNVHVVGMSGRPWVKAGAGFTEPDDAAKFVMAWWKQLVWPQSWSLDIDGYEYEAHTLIQEEAIREHITYCLDLHRAFYEPAS